MDSKELGGLENMTEADWRIDVSSLEAIETPPEVGGVTALDSRIEHLYQKAKLPFDIVTIIDYAIHLNVPQTSERVPWIYKLMEMDKALGPGGYALRFRLDSQPKTYAFFQLRKYDSIYRPMKYVYMPFGLTSYPAGFSRDIAERACAHVEKCVLNLFESRGLGIESNATLGKMIYRYPNEFDGDTFGLIKSVNSLIYGKTKHKFDVELPRLQLLSLAESLAFYFVCRVLGLKLLQQAGTMTDILSEIKRGRTEKGVFIGMEWPMGFWSS